MAVPHPDQSTCSRCCYRETDVDICHEAAVFGEGGFQVLETVNLFKPYPIHVDLCSAVASDCDFVLIRAGFLFI